MRKLAVALALVAAILLPAAQPASAAQVSYTFTIRHQTFTCTITFNDKDNSGTLTRGDTITAVNCARVP